VFIYDGELRVIDSMRVSKPYHFYLCSDLLVMVERENAFYLVGKKKRQSCFRRNGKMKVMKVFSLQSAAISEINVLGNSIVPVVILVTLVVQFEPNNDSRRKMDLLV
jgi:hypothetical protein